MNISISKTIGTSFLVFGLVFLGVYVGRRIENEVHTTTEVKWEHVSTIAVVDLDEGIIQDEKPIYYSRDFLTYSNPNFTATSLEDARQGIRQGRYGAYVIIPASFSRSVASINEIPQKSILEYSVNPNLDQGIRSEVVSDIQQFQLLLNTNISYVYVSSILDEFHNSQDASVIVLKNDENELEKLSGIEAEKLLHNLVFSDLEPIDYELEDLDVDGAFAGSEQVIDQIGDEIFSDLQDGQREFESIREQNDIVDNASRDLFGLLEALIPGQSLSGNLVYEEGLDELERTIDAYHSDIASKRETISNRLFEITNEYRTLGEEYLNIRIPQLQQEVDLQLINQVNLMQEDVDEALEQIQQDSRMVIEEQLVLMQQEREDEYDWIQVYINQELDIIHMDLKEIYEEEANQQMQEILEELGYPISPGEATPSDATPSDADLSETYRIALASSSNAEIDISQSEMIPGEIIGRFFPIKNAVSAYLISQDPDTDIWIALQTASVLVPDDFVVLPSLFIERYQTTAVEIEGLYYVSIDNIRMVLQEQVIEAIEQENEIHRAEIELMMDDLREAMDDYDQGVDNFDPYIFVHLDNVSDKLVKVNQNIGLIDQSVYEKTNQDRAFVDMVSDRIDEHTDIMWKDMEESNEQTLANILNTIESIQSSRIETNEENTYLLSDFTRKLSYTRLGSIGNKEVYDFIANPVSMVFREPVKQSFFSEKSDVQVYLLAGVLLVAITVVGTIILSAVWSQKKRR